LLKKFATIESKNLQFLNGKVMLMNFKNASSLMVLVLMIGCTSRSNRGADIEFDNPPSLYHVVNKGDTVASIATQHHIDPEQIIQMNKLQQPFRILPGQVLTLDNTAIVSKGPRSHGYSNQMKSKGFPYTGNTPMGDEEVEVLELPKGNGQLNEDGFEDVNSDSTLPMMPEEGVSGVEADEALGAAAVNEIALNGIALSWPVRGRILKGFSSSKPKNDGLNIAAPKGTPVRATAPGSIKRVGNLIKDFGNVILVDHGQGVISVYAHLNDSLVKEGQKVTQGQKIGTVGKTGNVKQTQLHFEVRDGTKPVDPKNYLQ
jgi:lipoprotein NlpD